jgi:hypothetical protein
MKLIILSLICLLALQASSRSHHSGSYSEFLSAPAAGAAATPKLSQVVLQTNDQGLIEFNTFLDACRPYNLTQGEVRSVFRLCDLNRDDRLSQDEWETCINVFVAPYENTCLKAKDYMLAAADITKCLKGLPIFDVVPAKLPDNQKVEDAVFETLSRDDKKINFADYIFLRRISFAWKECSVDDRIAKRRMECALSATTALKRKFLPVSNQVFNVAIMLYKTKVKENEAFLDFFSFAKIAYIYYYFNEFELPFQEEYITKKALLKGIEDQILPTSVTVEMANQIYYAIDPDNNGFKGKLDFAGYASVSHLFKVYKKNSELKKNKRTFAQKQFDTILKDPEWDQFNNVLLDAVQIIADKDYTAIVDNKDAVPGLDDREYFTRFAETRAGNADKTKLVFSILDSKMQQSWNFTTLVEFAKLTWAFQHIDVDEDGLINNDDVSLYLMGKTYMIPFSSIEMKRFETISETIRAEQINVKEFYSFFTFKQTFKYLRIINTAHAVILTNLKLCMTNLGLKLSNATLKFSKEFLALSKLPSYNYEKAFRRSMKEEIMVNKVQKMKDQDKKFVKSETDLAKNSKNYKNYFESEMKGDINWNNQP